MPIQSGADGEKAGANAGKSESSTICPVALDAAAAAAAFCYYTTDKTDAAVVPLAVGMRRSCVLIFRSRGRPMTERELLLFISRAVENEDVPDFTPATTGALLFDTMIAEWERLSADGRDSLMLVLGMMAKELSAEARAERTTAKILQRLQRAS